MFDDDVLTKISWLKGSKKAQWLKSLNYYFSLKHRFNHRFPMFFQVSTIINDYFQCFFRCNHRNNFFPTISDHCDSCGK